MSTRIIITLIYLITPCLVKAQEYPLRDIPDSLLMRANAVIRFEECKFNQSSLSNAEAYYTKVITLLNTSAKSLGSCVIFQDKFRELKSFSGLVQDANGKQIKKISKSDLKVFQYSSSLASDDKYAVYEFHPSSYPVTIKYEYEIRYRNGIASYPPFIPIEDFGVAVQESRHSLTVPANDDLRHKSYMTSPLVTDNMSNKSYEWTIKNLRAIPKEFLAPDLRQLAPWAYAAPNRFCMEDYCGSMVDWQHLGLWLNDLQQSRTNLTEKDKEKVRKLVEGASSDLEKIKMLYQYLQQNTRYVGIQLGVGSLQPMSASKVAETSFGDCKALTNYMRAMLEAIGLPSIYTVISTDNKNVFADFANLNQMNHVILAVPTPTDTLWLECTSSFMPFKYIHDDIAGHQALLILPEGGRLCRLRDNDRTVVTKSSCVKLDIQENTDALASLALHYKQDDYEEMLAFIYNMDKDERINTIARSSRFTKTKVLGYNTKHVDTSDPELNLTCELEVERFANKSSNRLFIPLSYLYFGLSEGLKKDRVNDILIKHPMQKCDSMVINIPKGYVPESVPKSVSINNEFGSYRLDVSNDGERVSIIQNIQIKANRFGSESWPSFYELLKRMDKEASAKIVLKTM